MAFPETVEEFMEIFKVVDTDHAYSSGTEYVPIFRMKQWFAHKADVAPMRRGRWELNVLDGTPGYRPVVIICSECHRIGFAGTPYCPNCGVRMDGDG